MITKNSVVEIQNIVMNHKSQPVKSNPENASQKAVLYFHKLFLENFKNSIKSLKNDLNKLN